MTQIVCVSSSMWGTPPSRMEHLFSALPGAEMLYFEPPQMFFSSLRRPSEGVRAAVGVTAYTLPCNIPSNEEAAARLHQRSRKNAAFIRKCMAEHQFNAPLLWLCSPDCVELAFELTECGGLLYDCDRLWPEFPADWEAALAAKADVILAASPLLREHLLQYSENVALIPNGISLAQFPPADVNRQSGPADLARIPSPVLGTLIDADDFLELSPVQAAATSHPDWNFVFVGEASTRTPGYAELKKNGNVFFLGEKSPATLPRYLAGFDVCFSLLSGKDPDPIVFSEQLYQYLATGKPVVAMSGGNLDRFFPDVIYTSHFEEEFSSDCERALAENAAALSERRIQYAKEADWVLREEQLMRILDANGLLQTADGLLH